MNRSRLKSVTRCQRHEGRPPAQPPCGRGPRTTDRAAKGPAGAGPGSPTASGVDFGEPEYLTVLEFLRRMSNVVVNDGGTGLSAKLQVGTLLHGDKYVFVTEASQLGSWSVDQVFSRYRNYAGETGSPLSEREGKHLTGLMDEAAVVVDTYVDGDPEQLGGTPGSASASKARGCRSWPRRGITRSRTGCPWIPERWPGRRSTPSW